LFMKIRYFDVWDCEVTVGYVVGYCCGGDGKE